MVSFHSEPPPGLPLFGLTTKKLELGRRASPDKKSGIVNDADGWATKTMGDANYTKELFMRVITASIETMKIAKGLLGLEIG